MSEAHFRDLDDAMSKLADRYPHEPVTARDLLCVVSLVRNQLRNHTHVSSDEAPVDLEGLVDALVGEALDRRFPRS